MRPFRRPGARIMDQRACITYIAIMSKATFKQLGGFKALMRNPGLVLMTLRHGLHEGSDALGNQFYQRKSPLSGRARRWVVYAGPPDASCIGPEWHSWLHYTTDAPLPDTGQKPWQKAHLPNLTGTVAGYRPAGHDYSGGKRAAASSDYEPWTPDP